MPNNKYIIMPWKVLGTSYNFVIAIRVEVVPIKSTYGIYLTSPPQTPSIQNLTLAFWRSDVWILEYSLLMFSTMRRNVHQQKQTVTPILPCNYIWLDRHGRLCLATGGSPAARGDEERNICTNLVAAKRQAWFLATDDSVSNCNCLSIDRHVRGHDICTFPPLFLGAEISV